jgi:hypothetical protein
MKIASNWTDTDWNKLDKWLRSILKTETVTVTFTKKDGTERVMNCTLNPEVIPPIEIKESIEPKKPRKESTTSIRVFDTDIKEWRSFTTKSITQLSVEMDLTGEDDDTV